MSSVWTERVRTCASNGMTKSEAAAHLGVSRQTIYDVTKAVGLTWTTRTGEHVHGPGKRPQYRKGCEGCKAYMRERAAKTRKESNEQTE